MEDLKKKGCWSYALEDGMIAQDLQESRKQFALIEV